MKKLFVIIGESGSGKTTLANRLTLKYPSQFKRVITCTSRPKRIGEVDRVDYHFLPTEYFINNSNLVLVGKTSGGFNYGTRRLELVSDTHHMLLTSKLTGIKKLTDLGFKNIVVVHISISEELKIKRMRQRGDTNEMIAERLLSNSATANGVEINLGRIPIIELDASQPLDEKVESIFEAC